MEILNAEQKLNEMIAKMDEISSELKLAYDSQNVEECNKLKTDFQKIQTDIVTFAESLKQDILHVQNGQLLH